ncbi:bifunctional 3-(3-hydroxy-phenyl)propionate/3-hydroxycinnamic acid hydroxylase [Nocardioides sp. NPDC051685]|uniref:bifunctional 3-(3-hydroxy-phenyl)propionate/3-hydroxycinnamic acid hydroxylase n=1 Tax=Nocardioides sp. NPDC051685 TaxID=3364334 RepID=UPI0037998DE6
MDTANKGPDATDGRTDADVIIVGAGPAGLTLANLLGLRGQRVIVLEARSELIDYPRGVGLDDESARTMQTAGLWEAIKPHTVPHHVLRLVNGRGQVLAVNDPKTEEFGFPRKHGFIQPLVDRELAAGLKRFEGVEIRFGHRASLTPVEHSDRIEVTVDKLDYGDANDDGAAATPQVIETIALQAKYLVACTGGRTDELRTWMGAEFVGKSPSTRWLVIDVDNDPLGTPSVYVGADPRRPYVSIGLPHGIRRWEFMLFEDEPTELVDTEAFMHRLLERHVPDPRAISVIGKRVFTHHGRISSKFRHGRVFLAGDAAHLMPVWLGQGWNSGIRDATNLSWKLSAVLRGQADQSLLDSYHTERYQHASDMIEVNMTAGSVIKLGPAGARIRDLLASGLNLLPSVKSYFTELRFKPIPRFGTGVVVDQATLEPGHADASPNGSSGDHQSPKRSMLAPFVDNPGKLSPVGLQFIQPRVNTAVDQGVLLDDVLGDWWAVAAFGNSPARLLGAEELALAERLGFRFVAIMPDPQREWAEKAYADDGVDVTVVGDAHGKLKDWFDQRACGVVFLRPDRFVAAACLAQQTPHALRAVLAAASYKKPQTIPATDPEGAFR